MPIQVDCGCGKQLQVPEVHAGKRIRCVACGETQTVPPATQGARQAGAIRSAKPAEVVTAELVSAALLTCACEECGGTIKARPEQAGKKFKCPHCGAAVLIAYPEVEAVEEADEIEEEVDEIEEVEERPQRRAAGPSRVAVGMPPKSRKPVLIPDDDVNLDEEDEEEDDQPRRGKQGRKKNNEDSGSQTMLWVGIGGGAAVLLGGVVFALVYFLTGDSKTASAKNSNGPSANNTNTVPNNPAPNNPNPGMPGGINPPVANNPVPNNPVPNNPPPNNPVVNNPILPPIAIDPNVAVAAEKALLPADAVGFCVFHIGAMWKTPLIQDLKKVVPTQGVGPSLTPIQTMGSWTNPEDVLHFGVVIKDAANEQIWGYFTTSKPVDQTKMLQEMKANTQAQTYQGGTFYQLGNGQGLVHFASPTFVVVTKNEASMKEAIDRIAGRVRSTGTTLASAIEQVDKHQVVVGFTVPPGLKEGAQGIFGGLGNAGGPGMQPGGFGRQPGGRPGMQPGGRPGQQPGGPGMLPGGPGAQGNANPVAKLLEMVSGVLTLDINGNTVTLETTGVFKDEQTARLSKIVLDQYKQQASGLLLLLAAQGQAPPKQLTDALQNARIDQSGVQITLKANVDLPTDVLQKMFAQPGNRGNAPGFPGLPNAGGGNPGFPQFPGFPNNPRGPNPGFPQNPGGPNPGFPQNPGGPNPGFPNPGGANPGFPAPGAPMRRQ